MFSCLNLGASVEKLEVSGRYPQILGNSLRFMDNMGLTWHFVHCKILLELMGRLQLLKEPSIAVIIYVHITYIYTQYLEREREREVSESLTLHSCHATLSVVDQTAFMYLYVGSWCSKGNTHQISLKIKENPFLQIQISV